MGKVNGISYSEQLLMPEWKSKRKEIIIRDNNCCAKCGSKTYLQVHHKKYLLCKFAWEVPNEYLITLCKSCHKKIHGIGIENKNKPKKIKKLPPKKGDKNKLKKQIQELSDRDKKLQKRYNKIKAG